MPKPMTFMGRGGGGDSSKSGGPSTPGCAAFVPIDAPPGANDDSYGRPEEKGPDQSTEPRGVDSDRERE